MRASRKLHRNLLRGLLRLPMSFFDSQPSGRLMNRFTKDTQAVDLTLLQVCPRSCTKILLLLLLHAASSSGMHMLHLTHCLKMGHA